MQRKCMERELSMIEVYLAGNVKKRNHERHENIKFELKNGTSVNLGKKNSLINKRKFK